MGDALLAGSLGVVGKGLDIKTGKVRHGNAKAEAARGQIPITKEDLKRIPYILNSYDAIGAGGNTNRGQTLIYQKQVNGTVYYVEMVHKGRGVLRSKTMWKKPSRGLVTNNRPAAFTSETEPGLIPSKSSIPFEGQNIKKDSRFSVSDPFIGTEAGTNWNETIKPFGKYGRLVTDADGNHSFVGKNGQAIKLRVTADAKEFSSWNAKDPTITLRQTDTGEFEFDHELMHGMRDLGLITDAEWRKLQGMALANIDIDQVFKEYAAVGKILDRDGLQHEVVARAAQYWRKNGIPGEAKGVMQKIEQFLHDLARGMGLSKTTGTDVARDVMKGKPLGRSVPGEARGAERFSVPEVSRNVFGENLAIKDMQTAARQFAIKTYGGKSSTNIETGWSIGFPGNSIRKAMSHAYTPEHNISMAVLPQMVEKGKYLESRPDRKGRKDLKSWHYFRSGFSVDGEEYKVWIAVKETKEGHKYYDHTIIERLDSSSSLIPGGTNSLETSAAPIVQGQPELGIQRPEGSRLSIETKGAEVKLGNTRNAVPADWDHTASKTNVTPSDARQKANRTYAAVIDDLYQVKQVDNLTQGLRADEKAYVLALNARQAGGTTKHIVTEALVDPNGNRVGESLKDITKQIPKGKEKDFENYLIYRHAPSWLDQGHEVFPASEGITSQISRQRAAVYEAQNPQFKALGDRIIGWHKQLSQSWLVDTGLISQQQYNAMNQLYPDYVPFQRELTDAESLGGFNRPKGQPVKRAQGSQRKIISPIESMIEHADRYVRAARKNGVLRAIDNQIAQDPQGLTGFIERIRPDETYDKPNVVSARINGENVRYKINDPDLFRALEALSPKGDEGVIKAARQLTRMMKILTTGSNPIFATRNIARDLPMAYIASDTLTNVPGAREVQFAWGIVDALASIVTGGRYDPRGTYRSFRAMGGGSHSSAMAADRNLLSESKASILPGYFDVRHPFRTAGRGLQGVGRGIEMFTNAFETAPRYSEYKRTVAQQGDTAAGRQQGLFNAQDVTVNFSRHGSMAKTPDAFIPYLNAALQGIDKVTRIYQKDPLLATILDGSHSL